MSSNTGDGVSLLAEAYVTGPNSTTSKLYRFDLSDEAVVTQRIETQAPFIPGFDYQQNYWPVDERPIKTQKAGRRRYRRAVKHYGKTYTVTRAQVGWALVVVLGAIIMLSSLLFSFYVHLGSILGVM